MELFSIFFIVSSMKKRYSSLCVLQANLFIVNIIIYINQTMRKTGRNKHIACLLIIFITIPAFLSQPLIRPIARSGIQSLSSQDIYRQMVYAQTEARINKNNQLYGQYFISAHNRFSGYTEEQFKSIYMVSKMSQSGSIFRNHVEGVTDQQKGNLRKDIQSKANGLINANIPKVFFVDHCVLKNPRVVTTIKNQGGCGSCWAFAGIAEIQSFFLDKHKIHLDLSEQQMVDCLPAVQSGNAGCGGGYLDSVGYYASLYPISQQKYYRYTGKQGTCDQAKINLGKTFKISSYAYTYDCISLLNALITLRPIGVCGGVDINWMNYDKGVLPVCNIDKSGGHCFLLCGAASDGTTNQLNNWYKFKNSWGTGWGEDGYIRIYLNPNDKKIGPCGVCSWGGIYSI